METGTKSAAPGPAGTRAECCREPGCEYSLRNNYYEGKRLTPHSFELEQRYLNERRRLLNRAIHGWGVVYGFGIDADAEATAGRGGRLRIAPGLALDPCGRELLQVEEVPLQLDDLILLDERGALASRPHAFEGGATHWLLSAHYAERRLERVTVSDPCHCPQHEWDQTCETVRYSLRPYDQERCCADAACELECRCGASPCCDPPAKKGAGGRPTPARPHGRGGCRCLCEHLTGLLDAGGVLPTCDCQQRHEIEERCGRLEVDLGHGVPLACVEIRKGECGWTLAERIESCGPRRLVKRNDLLFDLVRGCDLTRIVDFGWKAWHRRKEPVSLDAFAAAFGRRSPAGKPSQGAAGEGDFWLEFSRPVRVETLRAECAAMTILFEEPEGGWWETYRVPIVDVLPAKLEGDEHAHRAVLLVDESWLADAIHGRRRRFSSSPSRVEIELRGDLILDCNGQAVDANAVGLDTRRSGNGTPGGTFLSTFRVAQGAQPARAGTSTTPDPEGASS